MTKLPRLWFEAMSVSRLPDFANVDWAKTFDGLQLGGAAGTLAAEQRLWVQTALTQNPDMKGIYTPAGGVFLSAVLQTLKTKDLLHPVVACAFHQDPHL